LIIGHGSDNRKMLKAQPVFSPIPARLTILRLHRDPRLGYAFINASQRTFRINDLTP